MATYNSGQVKFGTPGGILHGQQPQVKSEKDGMWDSIVGAGSRNNVLK